jgi:hypothetical protein
VTTHVEQNEVKKAGKKAEKKAEAWLKWPANSAKAIAKVERNGSFLPSKLHLCIYFRVIVLFSFKSV